MPIYEFRCGDCGGVSSFFTRSINSPLEPVCSHCQSLAMIRRMSQFATGKSVQSVHEQHSLRSASTSPDYYSDPRNIGRQVEERFARYGVEVPATVRESIDSARQGELPKGPDA